MKLSGFYQPCNFLFKLATLIDKGNRTPSKQWLVLNQKFPGAGYLKVLKTMHEILKPKIYLEIGVFQGQSFKLARPQTHAIGIDPAPKFKKHNLDNKEIHTITSDDFFSTRKNVSKLKGKIDFAFIDGLHTFEQVLQDFINVEKLTHKESVVVFHDVLPFDAKSAQKNRETLFWMGDVWKIFPCLSTYRPDLSFATVPTAPSGILVVTSCDSSSSVLEKNFNDYVDEFDRLDFSDFKKIEKRMNFIGNNFHAIKQHIERYVKITDRN